MAYQTSEQTLTEAWVDVADGANSVAIQVDDMRPVAVIAGGVAPAADAKGVVLSANGTSTFALADLGGDAVYVRALFAASKIIVVRGVE